MTSSSPRRDLAQQAGFWKEQIAGGPGPFELPTDDPRLPVSSFLRGRLALPLSAARWAGVAALAARSGADPFSVVLGAFALVASRCAGLDDLWLGTAALARGGDTGATPNLLALRLPVPGDRTASAFLGSVQAATVAAAANRDVPYATVAALAGAQPLFRVLVLPAGLRTAAWERSEAPDPATLGPQAAACDLMLTIVVSGDGAGLQAEYDCELFVPATVEQLLARIDAVLAGMTAHPEAPLLAVPLVSESERRALVIDWNRTDAAYDRNACVHQLIEQQVARTPDAVALVCADEELTYAELNRRANRLAHLLVAKGVGPDVPVGVCIERSNLMVIALLAVHKAGGAYIPMDPGYPPKRIAYTVEDSGVGLVLADSDVAAAIAGSAAVVRADLAADANQPDANPSRPVPSHSLAYIIYTSGSTGNPKGVMVEHRNVVNFFAGMDQRLGADAGVWLAVTSLSFDISVLEIFWTLSRGFKVVLYSSRVALGEAHGGRKPEDAVGFGLFYFASDEGDYAQYKGREKYKMLIEGARFADEHGFSAVWTPERHFHIFGGMYPSPSVTAGALAMITKRIGIRAGSVVLPLHNPIRVAEEWSLVDNLSDGRVAISFASGWQPQDFAIAPEAYADRQRRMFEGIETVRGLWRGETRPGLGGDGKPVTFSTRPRPIQAELPVWITAGGSPETFRRAGEIGANVLTHLLQQSIEQLDERLAVYRKAWQEHGHPGEGGQVSLMLHTFVSHDAAHVRAQVHEPFKNYLKGAVSLFAAVAPKGLDLSTLSPAELEELSERAFERYFETSGLFGTPESCVAIVDRLHRTGVTEIACLIDFGIPTDTVLASLPYLDDLRRRCAASAPSGQSIDALLRKHGATHLQCTPSMASMLVGDPETASALVSLKRMLVGGEALGEALAAQLERAMPGGVLTNMYGPTETTVWSMTHDVDTRPGPVPIGRPIANTQVYVLDPALNPVPAGMIGELYIGGDGVTRGYFKRPELSRERFVNDPFRDGRRLYRTGDLARHRADGTLEFLGRGDHQIKLRGYRIELGEIEAQLARHPSIRECVVVAREDTPGDPRLVAYYTAKGDAPSVEDLRRPLRESLPEVMVPSAFVLLPALPLTPNGKVDRKLLPAPSSLQASVRREYVAPAGGLEEKIAAVWREVLHLESVGVGDNFFDLGGHSLLVVQVHRALRDQLDQPLSLTDLYRFPTIGSLAAFLSSGGEAAKTVQDSHARGQKRRDSLLQGRRRKGQE